MMFISDEKYRKFIRGVNRLDTSSDNISALVEGISSLIESSFAEFSDSDTEGIPEDSSSRAEDIHLKLNPILSFYDKWFRPLDNNTNVKRPEEIDSEELDFEHAFITAYSNQKHTQEPIAIDAKLEARVSKLARDYFGKDSIDNPFAGLLIHQIMKPFREENFSGSDDYDYDKVGCYLDIIGTKLYICFKERNVLMLESLILNCRYGMSDSKKRRDMDSVNREFMRGINEIIDYIIELPDVINRYFERNQSAFVKELCLNKSFRHYFSDVRELVHALEDVDSACSHSKYDKKKIHANILNANKKSILKKGFYDNLQRLIRSGECEDENELIEVASLDVPDYIGLRKLGSGGSGDVYLAKDTLLNRDVALKIFRTEELSKEIDSQRKRRGEEPIIECLKILLDFEHKNLSKHYGHFRLGNDIVLVKEYIDGKNLHDWLGKLDPNDIRCVFNYMLDVTDHLHKKNFILRDIKLENVLLSQDKKTVKIDDLETALLEEELRKRVGDAKEAKEESKQDDIRYKLTKGSEIYAAPEIAGKENRNPNFSFSTDIYALGACLLYMLRKDDGRQSGHWSLKEINILDAKTYDKKLEEVLEGLPYRYSHALKKALAYKPEDRFKDIEEFRRELIPTVPTITEEEINQIYSYGFVEYILNLSDDGFADLPLVFRCYDRIGQEDLHFNMSIKEILGYDDEEGKHPLFFIGGNDEVISVVNEYGQINQICTDNDETLWLSGRFDIDPCEVVESVVKYIKTKSSDVDGYTLFIFERFLFPSYHASEPSFLDKGVCALYEQNLNIIRKYLTKLM